MGIKAEADYLHEPPCSIHHLRRPRVSINFNLSRTRRLQQQATNRHGSSSSNLSQIVLTHEAGASWRIPRTLRNSHGTSGWRARYCSLCCLRRLCNGSRTRARCCSTCFGFRLGLLFGFSFGGVGDFPIFCYCNRF